MLQKQESKMLSTIIEPRGFGYELDVIYANFYREIKRFLRAKSRIIGSIIQPIFWMIFFGVGWSSAFKVGGRALTFGGISYLDYLIPGVIMMTVFFSGFFAGITVIFDRDFGFLKEVLVAPAPRWASLLGRSLGSATVSLIQGLLILAIGFPLAPNIAIANVYLVLIAAFLVSLSFTGLGILLALKITSHEGFQLIVNLLGMPILFVSGVFYPIDTMPEWMKMLAYINPLTYAVDISRYALVGTSSFNIWLDFGVLLGITVVLGLVASYLFDRAGI
ncbi:MAG: ABC transporter permease [Candidatus Njordarchaeia archaeon]